MPSAFSTLEARVDRAVFRHLANTSGLLDGEPVRGIFDEPFAAVEGIGTSAPQLTVSAEAAARVEEGTSQFVRGEMPGGTVYTVVEATPDGAGMTVLRLRNGREC